MKVFQLQDEWSLDGLRLAERPEPSPGPGEVKLRIKAASLNYRDLLVLRQGYGRRTGTLPLVPVSDGVGEVVEVGRDVRRVRVGDRACPMFMPGWIGGPATRERLYATLGGPLDGVMSEYVVAPEDGLALVPDDLRDEEAATLPCAALTAWTALVTEGRVKAGDSVLIQGTGGVALFALQIAKLAGARVMVISSSDAKLDRARRLGADHGLNYTTHPEWGGPARDWAGGEGVDHVVELGGQQTLPQTLRAVRPGGTVSLIGVLSGGTMDVSLGAVVTRFVRLQGITVGNRDSFESMVRAFAHHRVAPVIDRVFPFAELKEALAYLAGKNHFGKICIRHTF